MVAIEAEQQQVVWVNQATTKALGSGEWADGDGSEEGSSGQQVAWGNAQGDQVQFRGIESVGVGSVDQGLAAETDGTAAKVVVVGSMREGWHVQMNLDPSTPVHHLPHGGDPSSAMRVIVNSANSSAAPEAARVQLLVPHPLRLEHADTASTAAFERYGMVVVPDSRHELDFDGSFTVETGEQDSSGMLGVSLHPDGSLLFAKADGSQWQLSGNQLHTRAELEKGKAGAKGTKGKGGGSTGAARAVQAKASSPARKLQTAKHLDDSINSGGRRARK
jgi:hypothetical protein